MNNFNNKSIIIFDMEVADFILDKNVLVQFSARKYLSNNMIDKLDIIIKTNFDMLPDDFIVRTRISKGLIKKSGIEQYEAFNKIKDFIDTTSILVAYKGEFFYFKLLSEILNKNLKNKTIDIFQIFLEKELLNSEKDIDEISLHDIANILGIDFNANRWNNASYDVSIIEKIFFKLFSL